LLHGGAGVTTLKYQETTDIEDGDQMLNFTVGANLQLRLTDGIALFADLSLYLVTRQDRSFDGTAKSKLQNKRF
jgi:OOP family OmpA-OmpF porin